MNYILLLYPTSDELLFTTFLASRKAGLLQGLAEKGLIQIKANPRMGKTWEEKNQMEGS